MFHSSQILRVFVISLIIILLQGCTKDLDFDFSKSEKKVVINSIFYPYEHFTVRLTSSRNILDPDGAITQISNAYVQLSNEAGELEVLEEIGNFGVYKTKKAVAFPGEIYTLTVIAEDFNNIVYSATSSIPLISEGTTIDTSIVSYSNAPALKVSVKIDDIRENKEKYIFEVEVKEGSNKTLASLFNFGSDFVTFGDKDIP